MRHASRASLVCGLGLAAAVVILAAGCTKRIGGGGALAGAGGSSASGSGGSGVMDGAADGPAIGGHGASEDAGAVGGGHPATGGSRTTGSGASTGDGGATGAGGATIDCMFTVESSTSTNIPTVGIVTFDTTLTSPTQAHIDFGLDTSYGMSAPVDLRQPSARTLLLGMKPSKTYHFRIVATNASGSCASPDGTIATGALPPGLLPPLTVTTYDRARLYGGFLILTQYAGTAQTPSAPVAIIDADGDYVWWYADIVTNTAAARMTDDGASLWINSANIPAGTAQVHKVTMDGSTDADFSIGLAGAHHQLAPLPDGSVAFCAYDPASGCDDLKLFPANGTTNSSATTVVDARTAHGGTGPCTCGGIAYAADDDTLVFSDVDDDCVTKVTRTGSTVWVLNGGANGTTSWFTGDTWTGGVHGIQMLSTSDLLLFNNNTASGSTGSIAIEMQLDTNLRKATRVWSYTANPGIQVDALGDVQRLPNGNTVIGYATRGELQEVHTNGALLQDIKWPAGTSFGYIEKRPSLYGKPIR
jgi:hypothetical protein